MVNWMLLTLGNFKTFDWIISNVNNELQQWL